METSPLVIVTPATVLQWQRRRFREYWTRLSRRASAGRPQVHPEIKTLIGSVRRECLNHVLVLSERHLRRILVRYFAYYRRARTHLSLAKDAPAGRSIERPGSGPIIAIPEVGGLHHRYARRAA